MNELAERAQAPAPTVVDDVIARGDLSKLTPQQRVVHYHNVCRSLGLNPLTEPFQYVTLNGKLKLYAKKDATDQLRKVNGINIEVVSRSVQGDLLTVHVRATDKTGRRDEDFGAVSVSGLRGEAAANAMMKAVTKAKRRVTLSISGLGFSDETELDPTFATPEEPVAVAVARADTYAADLRRDLNAQPIEKTQSSQPHEHTTEDREGGGTGAATNKEATPPPVSRSQDATWSEWATKFIADVRACETADDINNMITDNAEHLSALAQYDAGKHAKLVAMVQHQIAIRGEQQ
ncbi:hypothetical protein EHM76_00225 [bacterium]|nr:MAG: hypothetical protein EHM76_00225 [bacterium]